MEGVGLCRYFLASRAPLGCPCMWPGHVSKPETPSLALSFDLSLEGELRVVEEWLVSPNHPERKL